MCGPPRCTAWRGWTARSGGFAREPGPTWLDWLEALADSGLHVPVPQRSVDGTRLHRHPDGRYAVLLTWLAGRQYDRGLAPARLESVGRLTGAMHRMATSWRAAGRVRTQREATPLDLPAWAAVTRAGMQRQSPTHRAVLRDSAARLHATIETFGRGPEGWGLVHGDLHPWNLLFARDAAGAIDFTDCGMGHHAMDLAATLQYLRHPLAGNHDHRGSTLACATRCSRLFLTLAWIRDDWPTVNHRPWGPGFVRGSQRALRERLVAPEVG